MTNPSHKRRILITGAAGRVGQALARAWANTYDLVLVDIRPVRRVAKIPLVVADATDIAVMRALCKGVDTVIPLAISGNIHDNWDTLVPVNLAATQAAFQAAGEAGCRRVIFPSSVQIELNPESPYTASKRWGESTGKTFSERNGLSVICLRLGAVKSNDFAGTRPDAWFLDHVLTHRDCAALFTASVEAPDELMYGVFWGISANTPARFDITETCRQLGYQPQDNAFHLAKSAASSWRGRWQMAKSKLKPRLMQWLHL